MIQTRFQILQLYTTLITRLRKAGIRMESFHLSKGSTHDLGTPESNVVVKALLEEVTEPTGSFTREEAYQQLRVLNYNLRYLLQGDLVIAALLLKEHLPTRPDIRQPNFRIPIVTGVAITAEMYKDPNAYAPVLFEALAKEDLNYINALLYDCTQASSYAANIKKHQHQEALEELENISSLWYISPDNPEHQKEIMLCRTLAEVDHEGVPKQLGASSSAKVQALRSLIPAIHAVDRYVKIKQHPFYRFINDLPDLISTTLSFTQTATDTQDEDMLLDLLPDTINLATRLRESSENASTILSRFHHGNPVYKDLITVCERQNTLVVAHTNDIMYRFGAAIKAFGRYGNLAGSDTPLYLREHWIKFLANTRILEGYVRHGYKRP